MKVLVIGQGGREHAIAKALLKSNQVSGVHLIPGSAGIATEAMCHAIDYKNFSAVLDFCKNTEIDLIIIGPEDPLVMGLSDALRKAGFPVVGPSQEAAQLEGSKAFSKEFMISAEVATAKYLIVNSVEDTLKKSEQFSPPWVLKVSGLAAGKGVSINWTIEELKKSAYDIFERKIFGEAEAHAVLEQYLQGYELSLLVLTNGKDYEILPVAQDHKQLFNDDKGPNTGGMGTIAPIAVDKKLLTEIQKTIIDPTMREIQKRNFDYKGVIFFGIMVTAEGPKCLEYNVRFGDPETQVILPLLDGDWAEVFRNLAFGKLQKLRWKDQYACCVVLAAEGYPESPKKGTPIKGDALKAENNSYFVHSGTTLTKDKTWATNGGRVLGAVGIGSSFTEAQKAAYSQAAWVSWQGLQMRTDIGARKNKIEN